jgi:hypothetical protein
MLGNWINQTTTTTGTGALTLAAVSGFPPASSQFATNERFQYAILDDATGAPLERGLGYLDGSGNLVREKPLSAMVAGVYSGVAVAAVTLPAGAKRVICTPGAHAQVSCPAGMWAPGTGYRAYGDAHMSVSPGNNALQADRVYLVPFLAALDSDIDAVLIRVTTAGAAGKLATAAIYSVGLDGLPGVKLVESAPVAIDTIGVKAISFSAMRPPPRFFVALLCDGAPSIQHVSSQAVNAWPLGYDGSLIPITFLHHAGATGLAFPATWTPVQNVAGTARPQVVVRCPV